MAGILRRQVNSVTGPWDSEPRPAADPALVAAYPGERQRADAARWLGWLACRLAERGRLEWWLIPAWVPVGRVRQVRRRFLYLVAIGVVVLTVGAEDGYTDAWWVNTYSFLAFLALCAEFLRHRRRKRREKRDGPVPLVPVPPAALGDPEITGVAALRADRRACIAGGLAWTPLGALLGAFLTGWGSVSWPVAVAVVALQVAGAWVFGAVLGRSYPLLKFAEFALRAGWWRGGLVRRLEDAADRGLLRRDGTGYVFADDALRGRLAAGYTAAVQSAARRQAQLQAQRLALPGGARGAVLNVLSKARIRRISWDFALGAGLGLAVLITIAPPSEGGLGYSTAALVAYAVVAALVAFFVAPITRLVLAQVAAGVRLSWRRFPLSSRGSRLRTGTVAVVAVVALVAGAGTTLAMLLANALPPVLVAACGGWACVLTYRKTRTPAPRTLFRKLLRRAPDAVAVATTAATTVVLYDHHALTAQPAAGLLFPVAVWGTFRLWAAMRRSGRLAVKAAALLTFSLLLGGELVLFLVWLANVLGLSRPEVAAIRSALEWAGEYADLPWWAWTGLYALLLAVGLAFLRWPGRFEKAARRFGRWQLAPAADVAQQSLTVLHVGLMAIVLVGLAAPVTVAPVLSHRLTAAYDTAFQRELEEEGELAAYTAIMSGASPQTPVSVLASLVQGVHGVSRPLPGDPDATGIELHLAQRLGLAQATALTLPAPPQLPAPPAATASGPEAEGQQGAGGQGRPHTGVAGKADAADAELGKEDATGKRVKLLGDLAAKLLASLLSVPNVSANEVFQIVREFLSGLVEDSRLKDIFSTWLEHVRGARPPPAADPMVIPDGPRLEKATAVMLTGELTADNITTAGRAAGDPALARARGESPVAAAVDLANQARYLQDGTGSCAGCYGPDDTGNHGGHPGVPDDDPPDIHIFDP